MYRRVLYIVLATGLLGSVPTSADVVWDFENDNDHGFSLWSVNPAIPVADDPGKAGDEALTGGLPDAGVAWSIGRPDQYDGLKAPVQEGDKIKADGTMEYNQPGLNHPFTFPVNGRGQESYLNTYNLTQWGDNVHTQQNDQIATSPPVLLDAGAVLTVWVHGGGSGTHAPELDSNPDRGYTDGSAGIAVLSAVDGSILESVLTNGHGTLRQDTINLSAYAGQKVYIEVIDAFEGSWGWIAVDEIQITNATDLGVVPPGLATTPQPDNETTDVLRDIILSWTQGNFADAHDVYFSTSFYDVNDGVALVSPSQDANSYDPGRLEFGQTYFWRVDEVNAPPDLTVFEGDVWSFTVEPFARVISAGDITATASSQAKRQGPENTINGSGLVDGLHSAEIEDMWATADGQELPVWIQYEFDRTYKLHEMLVWNYNGPSFLAKLGLQDVTVEYSTDGVNWILNDSVSVFNQAPGTEDYAANTTVPFGGAAAKYVKITVNSNWIGELFKQYGLSEVRFFYLPVWAKEPRPVSGAEDVAVDVTLSWRSGRDAAAHDVYLSTDEQAVRDGTVEPVSVADASHSPDLDLASTYYWRVDEVNEAETPTMWEGDVWSLTTFDHLVVDGFELYNDLEPSDPGSNRIFIVWKDGYGYGSQAAPPYYPGNGTGSTIGNAAPPFAERTIVRSGKQSMPYFYDNSGSAGKARYSEAEADVSDLKIGSDWTKGGVEILSLYFYGAPENNANASDRIYVALKDGLGHLASVSYGGEPSEMKEAWWHKWAIELKEFANAGVDLTNITTMYLGVGNRVAPQLGASGVLFFDDIRLLPSRPAPSLPGPEPISQAPVAHWTLDEGTGTIVSDTSGGHIGTVMGGVGTSWVTGRKGAHALHFNGEDNHYVDCGALDPTGGRNEMTCAVWAKWDGSTSNWQGLVCKRDTWAADGMMWQIELNRDTDLLGVFMHDGGRLYTLEPLLVSEWQHVAFTIDNAGNSVLYIDGQAVATSTTFELGTGTGAHLLIGATFYQNGTGQDCFNGALDDVYLFNDALTQGQIITLMDL
ncbi:MAG: hypothetical protein AMJ65_16395 [Phycisphaerae bacterium SG8_4]|nr:MAG: hypothetical protein AMJ65_16395 [Phycisphaerae bacterium SG8_4]